MAPHSSTLAWKIPWAGEPGGLQSRGSLRVGHDWGTSLSLFTFLHWRRKWQPTPVFFPGESQGWGSLVRCRLWGRTESDTTEQLHFPHFTYFILYHWRRKWHPTPVLLPGKSHGLGSLVGCNPWGRRELDTTEVTEHARTPRKDSLGGIVSRAWPKIHLSLPALLLSYSLQVPGLLHSAFRFVMVMMFFSSPFEYVNCMVF